MKEFFPVQLPWLSVLIRRDHPRATQDSPCRFSGNNRVTMGFSLLLWSNKYLDRSLSMFSDKRRTADQDRKAIPSYLLSGISGCGEASPRVDQASSSFVCFEKPTRPCNPYSIRPPSPLNYRRDNWQVPGGLPFGNAFPRSPPSPRRPITSPCHPSRSKASGKLTLRTLGNLRSLGAGTPAPSFLLLDHDLHHSPTRSPTIARAPPPRHPRLARTQ